MSPEQLRAEAVDARTDIYGAGAVLYEMATSQRAFPENQPTRLIDAILHSSPQRLSAYKSRSSASLETIIFKALEIEPSRRFQSARELLAALESGVVLPAPAPRFKWSTVGIVATGVILILGVVLGLNLGKSRDRILNRIIPGRPLAHSSASTVPVRDL